MGGGGNLYEAISFLTAQFLFRCRSGFWTVYYLGFGLLESIEKLNPIRRSRRKKSVWKLGDFIVKTPQKARLTLILSYVRPKNNGLNAL